MCFSKTVRQPFLIATWMADRLTKVDKFSLVLYDPCRDVDTGVGLDELVEDTEEDEEDNSNLEDE